MLVLVLGIVVALAAVAFIVGTVGFVRRIHEFDPRFTCGTETHGSVQVL